MGKQYRVHSHHQTTVPVAAKTEAGFVVEAKMPASIVELVPVDGGPTITLHEHTPLKNHQDQFVEMLPAGSIVEMEMSFTLIEAAPSAEQATALHAEEESTPIAAVSI